MSNRFGILIVLLALLIASCSSESSGPVSIVVSLDKAIMEGDMDAALALFADDGTIEVKGDSEYSGKDQLETILSDMLAPEGSTALLTDSDLDGENSTWIRELCIPDAGCFTGSNEVIAIDGDNIKWMREVRDPDNVILGTSSLEAIVKDGVISYWLVER